ncbi:MULTISPECIES: hypothetical protein [unclassified Bradyrhizobium]|uniref:hypothetical protein n=1 Tax=unclassified Bradyrhizobium TaxID=2631580 RepID=UPI0029163DEF|nr:MULTISPECIES: hypothetical protein [unclassified Bradyrhizobium]
MQGGESKDGEIPQALMWVKDAPLFIDSKNLGEFYDAVVRPPYEEDSAVTFKVSESQKKELEKKFGGKAGLHVPSWLSLIFSGGVDVSGEVKSGNSAGTGSETTFTLKPISSPHRRLEQLTIYYVLSQPKRLLAGGRDAPLAWQKEGISTEVPRALVFVDLPKDTKCIPMAAEFKDGKFVTFFDKLMAKSGERPPPFDREKPQEYWAWFDKNFDPGQCVAEIEKASTENGRIEWIDFRIPLNDGVDTMHIHIEAAGAYNTGTFAYRLIRRTLGHGIRLVGALKDGPDLNIMAIYEN